MDEHLRTRVPHIYAIGDVVRGPMLAHKASEEGIAAVEHMVRGFGHVDYQAIPSVVYTHPEIAAVGYTEEELKAQGIPYKVGKFPYSASGRARAMGETEGFIKVLAHAKTDRILGVHGIGARVGDVLAEAALALFFKASAEDLGRAPHAHPSSPRSSRRRRWRRGSGRFTCRRNLTTPGEARGWVLTDLSWSSGARGGTC